MRLTSLTVAATSLALAGTAAAGPHAHRACAEAGRAKVSLPAGLDGIDGFRIVVAAAGRDAQSDVTILAGRSDRTLRAFAPGVFALLMDEPLLARTFEVAIEPVLDARAPACVQRVELLRAGQVVATAEIR